MTMTMVVTVFCEAFRLQCIAFDDASPTMEQEQPNEVRSQTERTDYDDQLRV